MVRPRSGPPSVRELQNSDLLRIETWAMHGLGVDNIAVLLGLTPGDFRPMAEADPRIHESMLYGRNRGIAAVSQALFGSAISGRDSGAARFWLERLGPSEFKPPRGAPVIVVEVPKADPIREAERADRIDRMIERQRLLLTGRDFDADGAVVDLETPTKNRPRTMPRADEFVC